MALQYFITSLLHDPDFNSLIRREWAFFLDMNESPEISPSLLWETAKAVITGKIISYSSYKKKQQQQLEINLEQRIKHLTDIYSSNHSKTILSELNNLKAKLNSIINKKSSIYDPTT